MREKMRGDVGKMRSGRPRSRAAGTAGCYVSGVTQDFLLVRVPSPAENLPCHAFGEPKCRAAL